MTPVSRTVAAAAAASASECEVLLYVAAAEVEQKKATIQTILGAK
jgi:hypothetical protein